MKELIFTSSVMGVIKFRKELAEELIHQGYKVTICGPYDQDYVPQLLSLNINFIETKINRRGKNIITDGNLLKQYLRILKKYQPSLVITYTIKPNIYGGIACSISKTPYISNVTGLGTTGTGTSLINRLVMKMPNYVHLSPGVRIACNVSKPSIYIGVPTLFQKNGDDKQ